MQFGLGAYFSEGLGQNALDLLQFFGVISSCIIVLTQDSLTSNDFLLFGMTSLLLWVNSLSQLKMFEQTSAFVRMVVEIIKDIRYFILVFTAATLGMAQFYYLLDMGSSKQLMDAFEEPTFFNSVMYTFLQAQGEFGYDSYESSFFKNLLWILLAFNLLFINITLLNLLIAIMGDTYDRVKDFEEEAKFRELASFLADYSFFFPYEKHLKEPYIIEIAVERDEDDEADAWGGKLTEMKKHFQTSLKKNFDSVYEYLAKQGEKSAKIQEQNSLVLAKKFENELAESKQEMKKVNQNVQKLMALVQA